MIELLTDLKAAFSNVASYILAKIELITIKTNLWQNKND